MELIIGNINPSQVIQMHPEYMHIQFILLNRCHYHKLCTAQVYDRIL